MKASGVRRANRFDRLSLSCRSGRVVHIRQLWGQNPSTLGCTLTLYPKVDWFPYNHDNCGEESVRVRSDDHVDLRRVGEVFLHRVPGLRNQRARMCPERWTTSRKVDVRLPGKGNSHGARPVNIIIDHEVVSDQ